MLSLGKTSAKFFRLGLGLLAAFGVSAQASTSITANLNVSLSITATCTVTGGALAFGTTGLLTALLPSTGTLTVTCTNTTPYTVGLNQGLTGASVTTRQLHSPTTSANVNYSLYSDSGRTLNWGNTVGTWVSGTGAGSAQTLTVYGLIPLQVTPAPATDYADTVTITVTY
jgi:spore coat protein U-like protein